ncbi:MAG: sugar transferase [Patescibacteria group bacterium]
MRISLKKLTVIFSDIAILYGSLALTLIIRYGADHFSNAIQSHLKPFSLIFIFWILIFYLFNFYSEKFFKYNLAVAQNFISAIIVNIAVSMAVFYIFEPFFKLTPKTNLLIFTLIFLIADYAWRAGLSKIFIARGLKKQIIIIGDSPVTEELADYLNNNPQIGYSAKIKKIEDIKNINDAEAIVISNALKKNPDIIKIIYGLLPLNIKIFNLADFYEMIFQKAPLKEVEELWFIEQITTTTHFYDASKRMLDVVLSVILIIVFLPLMLLIAVLIKLNSKGPIIYKHERMGINDKSFILYKFRIMIANHNGPLVTEKNDPRLTFIGKIIDYTHLNEIPQLFNILKGDMSFIGPRPESSKLVEIYKKLPYYEIRHIIKPGLTGWAQVNYKPSASLEEAFEKLQYDIYYIKNRSLVLDFLILLKTIRYLFISH